eukprot:scaffold4536_cov113-Isochrysis_galbana.AAC.15
MCTSTAIPHRKCAPRASSAAASSAASSAASASASLTAAAAASASASAVSGCVLFSRGSTTSAASAAARASAAAFSRHSASVNARPPNRSAQPSEDGSWRRLLKSNTHRGRSAFAVTVCFLSYSGASTTRLDFFSSTTTTSHQP